MIYLRILSFIFFCIVGIFLSPIVLLPFALAHAFYWHSYELLVLAAVFDAFFGAGVGLPYYTLSAGVIIVIAEWIKPHLAVYAK